MKIKLFEQFNQDDKLIKTTYQVVSPESAEQGDYADQGWYDEEGESMIPDEWESEEGITVVDKTIDYLTNKRYATEPSYSPGFTVGISYTTMDSDVNYETDEDTYYTCHLYGFTPLEEYMIWGGVTGKKLSKKDYADFKQKSKEEEIKKDGDIYNL